MVRVDNKTHLDDTRAKLRNSSVSNNVNVEPGLDSHGALYFALLARAVAPHIGTHDPGRFDALLQHSVNPFLSQIKLCLSNTITPKPSKKK